MIQLESIIAEKIAFILPMLSQYGYVGILIITFTPIPISEELYIIPFVMSSDDKLTTLILSIMVLISGTITLNVLEFFTGKHIHKIHKKISKSKPKDPNHMIHKYGVKIFLIIPTISMVISPISDIYSIALGRLGARFEIAFIYILLGNIIRGLITFTMLYVTLI